jgi:hypothetical protein
VDDLSGKAIEADVRGHVVLMLVHPRGNDEVLRAILRSVRAGDVPDVAGLARVAHLMIEADMPFEIETSAIALEIVKDFDVRRKLGISLRHWEVGDLGDTARGRRMRRRHYAAETAVVGEGPDAAD